MAWSLTRKVWMKKASQVCEWALDVVVADVQIAVAITSWVKPG